MGRNMEGKKKKKKTKENNKEAQLKLRPVAQTKIRD